MAASVVITGVGAVTPLGVGAQTLHDRWCAGEVGIRDGVGRAPFDPDEFLSRKLVRRSDRFTQFALVAAAEALAQAGWDTETPPVDPARVACVVGTGVGGFNTLMRGYDDLNAGGQSKVSPLMIPLMMPNAAAAAVTMRHGIGGPSWAPTSACASGAHAIGEAARLIATGAVDAAVAGGAEATHHPVAHAAFAQMDALSSTGISRPFDARRDGFVMGEGGGIVVLESAETAAARGATVLAELAGYGASSDAFHLTAPKTDGSGAAYAITAALADAGLQPSAIDYVNAHGTSTPLNDAAETAALKLALGEHAANVPISSTKSVIGHLLGAAGAVEAVATILALAQRVAPPTVGYAQRDPELDLDYVPDGPRALVPAGEAPVAISNSFGFGGHNAVLVLKGVSS